MYIMIYNSRDTLTLTFSHVPRQVGHARALVIIDAVLSHRIAHIAVAGADRVGGRLNQE